jgi:hypothetical protein
VLYILIMVGVHDFWLNLHNACPIAGHSRDPVFEDQMTVHTTSLWFTACGIEVHSYPLTAIIISRDPCNGAKLFKVVVKGEGMGHA